MRMREHLLLVQRCFRGEFLACKSGGTGPMMTGVGDQSKSLAMNSSTTKGAKALGSEPIWRRCRTVKELQCEGYPELLFS